MINTLLITGDSSVAKKIEELLNDKDNHILNVDNIEELVKKDEIICDMIIYHIEKDSIRPYETLKILSENVPVIALVDGNKLKDSNKTSIKLIQSGAKTILYDIKESVLVHSIERIYDLEYGTQENSNKIYNK